MRRARFVARPRRSMGEPTLPLINVVFLLLIFVLLTSVIERAPPVPVELATSATGASPEGTAPVLYVAEAGVADEAAILDEDGLRRWLEERTPQRVAIRADRRMKAAELFGYVNVLEAAGVGDVELVVLGE